MDAAEAFYADRDQPPRFQVSERETSLELRLILERRGYREDARTDARARQLLPGSDSLVIDRALTALLEELEGERELATLAAHPYEADPEVGWEAPAGPDLPYAGDIPDEVIDRARPPAST